MGPSMMPPNEHTRLGPHPADAGGERHRCAVAYQPWVGRPSTYAQQARPQTVELDLATGERGSRQRAVGQLAAQFTGAEAAMVVNNNAAAVLLVVAALAGGRQVAGEPRRKCGDRWSAFRVPEVMEQGGATLVDVGTTNRTRLSDYRRAMDRRRCRRGHGAQGASVELPGGRVRGGHTPVAISWPHLGVPVVADIGSGLLDATCPWLPGGAPGWLIGR
jgi:L-seryl-tRNA(Ser) seleniumtransferase